MSAFLEAGSRISKLVFANREDDGVVNIARRVV
jgi:hypothetical protein